MKTTKKETWVAPALKVYGTVADVTKGGVKTIGTTDGWVLTNGQGLETVSTGS